MAWDELPTEHYLLDCFPHYTCIMRDMGDGDDGGGGDDDDDGGGGNGGDDDDDDLNNSTNKSLFFMTHKVSVVQCTLYMCYKRTHR